MGDTVAARPPSRAERREHELIDAAVLLFAEEGFHTVSTRKIAASVGVSEGTLFNYFGSKNELMVAVLRRIYRELTENASAILREELDSRVRLQRLAENHIRVMSRDNALFMRMIQTYMNAELSGYTDIRGSALHELNLSYAWVFDTTVREAIERGEVRKDINLSALRDLYFGGLEYCSRTLFLHDRFDMISERVASVVEPLWQFMLQGRPRERGEDRLDQACQRLESIAGRLEQLA